LFSWTAAALAAGGGFGGSNAKIVVLPATRRPIEIWRTDKAFMQDECRGRMKGVVKEV
jgi:hypothetical protein